MTIKTFNDHENDTDLGTDCRCLDPFGYMRNEGYNKGDNEGNNEGKTTLKSIEEASENTLCCFEKALKYWNNEK